MPRRLALLATLGVVVLAGGLVGAEAAGTGSISQRPAQAVPGVRIPLAGVREHLSVLQEVAERHGGNRLAGTAGYDASARYVASRLRAAGYRVRLQEFDFPLVVDRSPPRLRIAGKPAGRYRDGRDFITLLYSGSGKVEAPVVAVDLLVPSPRANTSTSGCESSDFAGFPDGAVALVQRGTCRFRQKVENAVEVGASAVIVFNEGARGRRGLFSGSLGSPPASVPVLGTTFALGDALRNESRAGRTGVSVTLRTDMLAERRTTRNVIAESRAGNPRNVVVVGAHLDGVPYGPGINDNGSGSAVILEVAEQLAKRSPVNRLRFIWWSAEELGLYGSRHYVESLSAVERGRIALYLNADMVGSRNFVRFVYDGDGSASPRARRRPPPGSAEIERVFTRYFEARKLPYRELRFGGGSDHGPFARAGIPVGGLFSGASGRKTRGQAAAFGGKAGRPFDPCYHRPCDTIGNVSNRALDELAHALAHAVVRFAQDGRP
jgi:Zn-dependent M28 family amino/carboxypeptidase